MNGKRLTRSSSNATLAGVCAGLGAYFGVDPTLMRVAAIVIGILTGVFPMVIAYALCALVIPSDTASAAPEAPLAPPMPRDDAPGGPDAA